MKWAWTLVAIPVFLSLSLLTGCRQRHVDVSLLELTQVPDLPIPENSAQNSEPYDFTFASLRPVEAWATDYRVLRTHTDKDRRGILIHVAAESHPTTRAARAGYRATIRQNCELASPVERGFWDIGSSADARNACEIVDRGLAFAQWRYTNTVVGVQIYANDARRLDPMWVAEVLQSVDAHLQAIFGLVSVEQLASR